MLVKGNNGKAAARRKSASSSSKSNRSTSLSKSNYAGNIAATTDKLDGSINFNEGSALQGEASNSILEESGIAEGTPRDDLSSGTTELTAITLHQPWASLIAMSHKQYETRDWPTTYRGLIAIHAGRKPKGKQELRDHDKVVASFNDLLAENCPYSSVIAIAQMTDCILMTEEFISQQSETELRCGDWKVGRYAFKLENVRAIKPILATGKQGLWKWSSDSWNPADFGEAEYKSEADGQLNFLQVVEPPDPDDYESHEQFKEDYKNWVATQPKGSLENFEEAKIWNELMDGSICVAESVQDSPMPESNCGSETPTSFANGMNIANQSCDDDSPTVNDLAISKPLILEQVSSEVEESASLPQVLPVNPSAMMEKDSLPETIEIASPQSLPPSTNCSLTLQLLRTLPDFSTVQSDQEATNSILPEFLTNFPKAGTMSNGKLSAAPILPVLGVEKESLLLRSPGALSTTKGRPPGLTRLESQLHQLGLIQDGEVVNPEFLESGYQLPIGYTNPQENRTALELSQVQAQQLPIDQIQTQQLIDHKSELQVETATTEIEEKPSEMPLTGELLPSDCAELTISVSLPPNIGALTKNELISAASEQHQLICVIERKEFELAIEKLHRVRLTGVYLQEFKKKCQYGEFENQLEQAGISVRSAQNYMMIAKNWETVEAKTKLVSLLAEENQPAIGVKWAIEAVRDEKKQLKSAAPPKDPDSWRTPNTKDQPVVALVQQALGGSIWLDPCSGSVTNHLSCAVRYYKDDDGLAQHQTWSKTVFINPPFSDPYPWVERCCLEFARGNVSAAVMLLKAGTVSNVGTGELINKYASAICHWRGRINFLNDEGNAVKGSDFDCVFVYFGDRLDLFRQAFQQRGTIATIDNHYSSVNKKFLEAAPLPEPQTLKSEQKHLAAAVGLSNGRSILPDRRDFDRKLMERYDPHTVDVQSMTMPTPATAPTSVSSNGFQPIAEPETFDETPLAARQFETAKQNTLNDYVTAISGNITEFSDEQVIFLGEILKKELDRRSTPIFSQKLRQSLLGKLHS